MKTMRLQLNMAPMKVAAAASGSGGLGGRWHHRVAMALGLLSILLQLPTSGRRIVKKSHVQFTAIAASTYGGGLDLRLRRPRHGSCRMGTANFPNHLVAPPLASELPVWSLKQDISCYLAFIFGIYSLE
jgi:hypothetical protein